MTLTLDDAVKKFLSKEDQNEIKEKGFYCLPLKLEEVKKLKIKEKDNYIKARLFGINSLKEYFEKTEEGKEWYEENNPFKQTPQNHSYLKDFKKHHTFKGNKYRPIG
ncbi:MAG: hypothetical protein Q8Q04_00765 [archaeon]|nr:hypothetical protein [archaeon]